MTRILIDHLTVEMRGRRLLSNVCLEVPEATTVALVGPNGAGKTTLLRCLLGLMPPTDGKIYLDGKPNCHLSPRQRAALLAWLPQQATTDETIGCEQLVMAARYRFGESQQRSSRAALEALDRVDAGYLSDRQVGTLSGGERQRVAVAALLAQGATGMLVDEPANHLDPAQQAMVISLLGAQARRGTTLVIVTHDVNLLSYLGEGSKIRVLGMSAGALVFDEPWDSPRLGLRLESIYGTPMHSVAGPHHRLLVPNLSPAREGPGTDALDHRDQSPLKGKLDG